MTIYTHTIGSHLYRVEVQVTSEGAFLPSTGYVVTSRDGAEIARAEYTSASQRDRCYREACAGVAERSENAILWDIRTRDSHEDLWEGLALWTIGIMPDGETGPVRYTSEVLAETEGEALGMASADLRRRGHLDADAAIVAHTMMPAANPSPIDSARLAKYWVYGIEGWKHYDLRPYYRGIVRV